eukprot:12896216-Prorocentrum_lima.AAC.1
MGILNNGSVKEKKEASGSRPPKNRHHGPEKSSPLFAATCTGHQNNQHHSRGAGFATHHCTSEERA